MSCDNSLYTYKDFVHLHNHTEYSMLDSTAKIKELIKVAKNNGMKSLAITDHGNMYGVLKFYNECKKNGIKPIIGCEIYKTNFLDQKNNERFHLILLAKNDIGYHNLIKIVSQSSKHVYYKPLVNDEILKKYHEGIICLSACIAGELPRAILQNDLDKAKTVIENYIDIFGKEDFYIEVQNHFLSEEAFVNKYLFNLADEFNLKVVATNDIHYVLKEDYEAQDVLLCIQTGKLLTDTNRMHFETKEFYFKTAEEMNILFKNYKNCLSNTAEIANKCNVEIKMKNNLSPKFPNIPTGLNEDSYLRKICEDSLPLKYSTKQTSIDTARERMNYELDVIKRMHYSGYFLIVWDFIHFAKTNQMDIGPGRGSGAGSIVSYLSGITELDPLPYNLLFERFLNPERVSMPDIDTDIADKDRDAVVKYMMETYHLDKSAQIVTFGTEAPKGAIRDVIRVFDLPYDLGNTLSKLIPNEPNMTMETALKDSPELLEKYQEDKTIHKVIDMAIKIEGLPRQTGTHAAGVVISEVPLEDVLPLVYDSDGTHTQYDKEEVEKIGLLKMDLLGLKILTIISDAKKLIHKEYNINIDFNSIPKDDKKTMEMLKNGDTFGVFQLEGEGLTDLVKKLSPSEYKDLIPLIALYRPGPLGSGMVDDFVQCCHGEKEISYLHPLLEPILKETYGVILYQEQVMKIVQEMAGFSLGKADLMRRAMGHKEQDLLLEQEKSFIDGCKKNNISENISSQIFKLMIHFASYGFNKSHSAVYAYIAYQTAYLKAHYPLEYMASYISCNLDKPEKIYTAIAQCKKNNIKLYTPNILISEYGFIPKNKNLIFGLGAIKNLGESTISTILEERNKKQFTSIEDFLYRIDISESNFVNLCKLNAFVNLFPNSDLLINKSSIIYSNIKEYKDKIKKTNKKEKDINSESLFDNLDDFILPLPKIEKIININEQIEPQSIGLKLKNEKEILGFYATNQPLDFCKNTLAKCVDYKDLYYYPNKYINKNISICGIIDSFKSIITKKGNPMAFITLNVYDFKFNCIVFPDIFEKYYGTDTFQKEIFLFKNAKVELKDDKLQLIVQQIQSKNL